MSNLPMGWVEVELWQIAELQRGKTITAKTAIAGNIPVISGGRKPAYYHNESNRTGETITVSGSGASAGFLMYWNTPIYVADAFSIQALGMLNNKWLYYFLLKNQDEIYNRKKGSGIPHVYPKDLANLSIYLPPKAEQDHIATLLDNHLSQVATISQKLNDILPIIKQFRQSVLAQAVSGKLLADLDFENWQTVKLSDIASILDPHPSHRTPKEVVGGVPYIGIGDLKSDGGIDFDNSRKVSNEILNEHRNRYTIKNGDFIFGKIGTLGKPTLLPINLDYTLSANVILVQSNNDFVNSNYLRFYLSAPQIILEITNQSNSTSQMAFGIKKMRNFELQLPPLLEQQQIVTEVERLFAVADTIETQVNEALERVGHLTQSILHQAFTGNLSADWRAYNAELITGEHSATALLAKIQDSKQPTKRKKADR